MAGIKKGKETSSQEKKVVDVYYACLAKKEEIYSLFPLARRLEIEGCFNEKVRLEKYSVWKLLMAAIEESFGLQCEKLNFEKKESGQWVCDGCYFSLSHSGDVVAVAVSDSPVGVDVEIIKPHSDGVIKKTLTERELQTFNRLNEKDGTDFFIEKWTQKESAYKKEGNAKFQPHIMENFQGESIVIEVEGKRYCLSVASDEVGNLRFVNKQ